MDDVVIRRVRPSDRAALQDFYASMSPDSRRQRFLGYTRGIADERASDFCAPDHSHEEGFVAVATANEGREDASRVVGHICLASAGPRALEIGIAVADELRHRGVGRRLFTAALAWAHDHGIERLTASAFADNAPVLRLLTSAPCPARITRQASGVVELTIPLQAPVPRTRSISVAQVHGARSVRRPRLRGTPHAYRLQRPSKIRSASIEEGGHAGRGR
jgi:GNAT superfamily N-acetyltransferase